MEHFFKVLVSKETHFTITWKTSAFFKNKYPDHRRFENEYLIMVFDQK